MGEGARGLGPSVGGVPMPVLADVKALAWVHRPKYLVNDHSGPTGGPKLT